METFQLVAFGFTHLLKCFFFLILLTADKRFHSVATTSISVITRLLKVFFFSFFWLETNFINKRKKYKKWTRYPLEQRQQMAKWLYFPILLMQTSKNNEGEVSTNSLQNQQANWSLNEEISSKIGSLLDLRGVQCFIKWSSPSRKASSIFKLNEFDDKTTVWHCSSSWSSSLARIFDLGSSDPERAPCKTSSRTDCASTYRVCLIRHRHRLQALLASGSMIWALRYTTSAATWFPCCM